MCPIAFFFQTLVNLTMLLQDLRDHLSSFHGGENVRVKVFTSPNGQIQGLAEVRPWCHFPNFT